MTVWKLYRWELRNLTRFPLMEIMAALFSFQAFTLSSTIGDFVMSNESSWRVARLNMFGLEVVTFITSNFALLYLPVAIFAAILASLLFAYESESGQLKVSLSLPITRGASFAAKALAVFTLIFVATAVSLGASASLDVARGIRYLFVPEAVWLIPGFLLASALFACVISGIAIAIATLLRGTAVAIVSTLAIFLGLQYAGNASHSPFLPPWSLDDRTLLYVVNPQNGAGTFWAVACAYAILGAVAFSLATYYYSRHMDVV